MINTIIIEDEKPAARKLARILDNFPQINLLATLHSVEEAKDWFFKNQHPQLVFSDIVLGDGLSFDIFEDLPTKAFIIYTTAFDQYTLKAFKLNSIDYLLKPIEEEEVGKAIAKFESFLPDQNQINSTEIRQLLKQEKTSLSRVLVKIGYNLKIINVEEITCFFSENKIVYLQTLERVYPTDFTLDELDQVLDNQCFFRANRQFIIQLKYIKNIHTSPIFKVELQAQPNEEITVSRDRQKDFKSWISS